MNFKLKWEQTSGFFFYYGSKIKYNHDETVSFENDLMSPGSVIVGWDSSLPFQTTRTTLVLPLLKRNSEYSIQINATSIPENNFFVMVTFLDRFDKRVGMKAIKHSNDKFVYPDDAYNYRVELINKGAKIIEFDSLIISDSKN
ncbi:accessory Sec system protein Asp3 [Lactobacillus sp. YT155]|uniref:accessory Sec system protein Asp3 n=1 Tax=Lactobacillus sp. YT155 TaxID=3060955 RepID=UPI00265F273B|nr:accessory Sec system protein Asp3 [Lactobacillus sp. YT155]MDO1605365.1 accessory Sec system protein Asp3 [Lactobacillus sp. YT155]